MERFTYTSLSSPSTSIVRVGRAVAFCCVVLFVTFWSGTYSPGRFQERLDFQNRVIVDDENKDPLLAESPAGIFNGSYYFYDNAEFNIAGMPKGIRIWEGIRFGKIPARFSSPELADPLPPGKIYQNYNAPLCIQSDAGPGKSISDDCLFLTVTSPLEPSKDSPNGYPVLVYFHSSELAAQVPGADTSTFSKNGVIGVLPNFRLGIFGTLATKTLSGNFGLEDQRLALLWVQQNIAAFGGNPKNVTIMGGSSGAQDVYAHLASPASHGLFSAAIMGSGPIGRLYPTLTAAMNVSAVVFKSVGCEVDDIDCMRSLSPQAILAQQVPAAFTNSPCIYLYFVDPNGDLPIQPFTAVKNGLYPDIPLLVSFVPDEGISFVMDSVHAPITYEQYPSYTYAFAEMFMQLNDTAAASEMLQEMYPYTADVVDGRNLLNDIVTDGLVVCPIFSAFGSAAALGKPTIYVDMFDHVFESNLVPSKPAWMHTAVYHGSDFPCVFDATSAVKPHPMWGTTSAERQMCHALNSAVSNFVQNGDPNSYRPLDPSMHFIPLDSSGEILIVDTMSKIGRYSRYDICLEFWNAVQPIPGPNSAE